MVTLRVNRPLARKVLILVAGFLAIWAVVGFLLLPGILRGVAERRLSESLHRPVTLRRLALNPFTFSATLEGLDIKEKGGTAPFLSFERLFLNIEAISLLRGGPVVRAVRLTKPSIALVRNADGTYNVQDLLDEASKPKPPSEKPLRFSFNNIQIEGGSLDFDDRPGNTRHSIREIAIGIPFLSNIPSKVEITTQPVFHAKVNGAPFDLRGTTKPFSQTHETTVNLNLSDVDLPYYLSYVPKAVPSRITAGRLDAKLTLAFLQPAGGTSRLIVSGNGSLRKLAAVFGGKPAFQCERFEAVVTSFDVFGQKVRVASLTAIEPEFWGRRQPGEGHPILEAFFAPTAKRQAKAGEPAKAAEGKPLSIEAAEVEVRGGKFHFEDTTGSRPFQAVLSDVSVDLEGLSTAPGKAATLRFAAKSDAGETFRNTGTVTIEPPVLEGQFEAGGLPLKRYAPFYEKSVLFDVDDGVLDLKTKYRFVPGAGGNTTLTGLSAELKSPSLRKRGESGPFFRSPSIAVSGTNVDLGKREADVGEVATSGGVLAVVRDKDGNPDLAKLVAESPAAPPAGPPQAPWNVRVGKLGLGGYTVKIVDHSTRNPARYSLTKLDVSLENLSTARGSRSTLATRFGVDGKGTASAKGPVGLTPIFADLKVDVKGIPLVPIQPYVVGDFDASLARGAVSADGALKFGEGANGKATFTFSGNALVADFLALEAATNLDFLRWDGFSAQGMRAGFNPVFLEISRLALTGFGCDFTIEPNGTTSLQRILRAPTARPEGEETEPAEAAQAAGSDGSSPAAPPAPAPAAAASTVTNSEKVPIRIDTLTLERGRVRVADRFIQPNYSATLGDLSGKMAGLSTVQGTVASLDLKGSLANHSPLEISGSVNPLAATAFADVKATFRDIDLPPFTPYSGKYAGYAISRGSLTMEVAYKLDHRKLSAQNHFLVDQFDFGEKVESKDATKLPVRLAVSLLKDKDGVIDLDLPIEGSLDDPKFKIWGVLWKVVGNLVGKAVTAPFTLLGKLLGGGGQEFSSVDFAQGRDTLDDAAKKKLDGLAKALANRPALKLEATGRTSGDKDKDALRELLLERRVKAQKLAEMAKKGDAPPSVDEVVVDEKEYGKYLEKAYKKESFSKPRNTLGFAKSLPESEMRELMLANLAATDDDMRQLALSRANAVKDYLVGPGKVEAARVFVLEPGTKPAGGSEKPPSPRVDFSLR